MPHPLHWAHTISLHTLMRRHHLSPYRLFAFASTLLGREYGEKAPPDGLCFGRSIAIGFSPKCGDICRLSRGVRVRQHTLASFAATRFVAAGFSEQCPQEPPHIGLNLRLRPVSRCHQLEPGRWAPRRRLRKPHFKSGTRPRHGLVGPRPGRARAARISRGKRLRFGPA